WVLFPCSIVKFLKIKSDGITLNQQKISHSPCYAYLLEYRLVSVFSWKKYLQGAVPSRHRCLLGLKLQKRLDRRLSNFSGNHDTHISQTSIPSCNGQARTSSSFR